MTFVHYAFAFMAVAFAAMAYFDWREGNKMTALFMALIAILDLGAALPIK